jgi:hypothetical protein
MYLSKHFLNSIITGFGFTSGTLISLHLYALIFNEEINNYDENDENDENTKEEKNDNIIKQIEKPQEIEEVERENEQNVWILCRILRTFFSYRYYI